MAQTPVTPRRPIPRLLRQALSPLDGALGSLAGTDLNIVALVFATVMLCGIGLLAIYMATSGENGDLAGVQRQGTYVIAGLAVLVLTSMIDYRRWGDIAYPAYALTLLVLAILVMARVFHLNTPLFRETNGAWCWIYIGPFQFQPSEFAKITYIAALSWYLRYRTNYRTLLGMLWPLSMTLLPMVLILLEPDLGTVMLMLPVFFAMLLVAGAKRRHLLSLLLICMLAAPILYSTSTVHPYQRMRILGAVLQSDTAREYLLESPRLLKMLQISEQEVRSWKSNRGYQLEHSKIAIGSGGLLGFDDPEIDCTQYNYLPHQDNDFIFAVIGHKWGLAGCIMVIGCYGIIVLAGCSISTATNEPFGRLLAVGVVMLIATQAAVNIGVTTGLLPVTGVTLPLVSSGGSSLLACGVLIGILLSVGLRRPIMLAPEPFVFKKQQKG